MKKLIYLFIALALLSLVQAGRQSTGSINVTMLSQDPDPAFPGGYVEVRFKMENTGTITCFCTEKEEFDFIGDKPSEINNST